MKKLLEKQSVFLFLLKVYARLARWRLLWAVKWLTSLSAKLNISLNKPIRSKNVLELANQWRQMMPPDGQEFFKINVIEDETAFVEIHLQCPLRGSGDVKACHHLMNYDRQLMDHLDANLVVLESQSNSGKSFCTLAIRPNHLPTDDLKAAYQSP